MQDGVARKASSSDQGLRESRVGFEPRVSDGWGVVDGDRRTDLWALFESRFSNISTDAFLRDAELTRVIAPLTQAHAEAEADALCARLSQPPAPMPSARIALSNCQLSSYTGSELWTADMARLLTRRGWPVIVHAPVLGAVADAMRSEGLNVTSDMADVERFAPDVMSVNHFASARPLLDAIGDRAAVVNMIHGLLPLLGLPGRSGVRRYGAVSLHAKAKVHLLTGADWRDIPLMPNFFDAERFTNRGEARQRRALLFSFRAIPEQRQRLQTILAAHGYELDHVGSAGESIAAPEALLPQYDLVFAVGRSAIEAMACGCRVILWDSGIVGPMVTAENFWLCAASNFSVASCALPFVWPDEDGAAKWVAAQVERTDAPVPETIASLSLDNVGPQFLALYASS